MTNTEQKLVSIGLPTYQGERRIQAALDSLTRQTHQNIELIISDNASSDQTRAICEEYAKKDPRICFFCQKENTGRINNFLFVLEKARGDYFMWAGDDDTWDASFIETLVKGLESHTGHGVALSSYRRVLGDSNDHEDILFTGMNDITDVSYYAVYKKIVLHEPIHVFISGLWRTDVARKIFARPIPTTIAWDRIMMAEAALVTHFYAAPARLFYKYINLTSIKSRYGKDPEQDRHVVPFAYIRYLMALLTRMVASPLVPWRRKWYVLFPWLRVWWHRRKRIIGVVMRDARRVMH